MKIYEDQYIQNQRSIVVGLCSRLETTLLLNAVNRKCFMSQMRRNLSE